MAIKRYKASADNTIVNAYQVNLETRGTGANTGEADVLETFSIYGRQSSGSQELSRILIKFPVDDIVTDRSAATIPASGNVSFYLRVYNAENSKTVPKQYKLSAMAVSQSWEEGVGLNLEGYTDLTYGNSGSNWMSASKSAMWTDISDTLLAGGSYHTGNSDAHETHLFTQTFTNGLEDMELDITPLVEQWIDSTYDNYGVGISMSSSYEAYVSGTDNETVSRLPGVPDPDTSGQSVIYNPSGSTRSYYTKRFFGRGSQYFFKLPNIEARWNSATTKDDRGNFFFSSSLASAAQNMNTIYLYNYVRGQLSDIPNLGDDKRVYVSIYSGSTGGFYTQQGGADGDDVPPMDIPVSGTTGSVQVLSADDGGSVSSDYPTVITGGIVSTGIYSASFAFTGTTLLQTIYDVWFTGSDTITDANDASTQYFTGAIDCRTLEAQNHITRPVYYLNITNLRDKYRADETGRFNLFVRQKYWSPTIYTVANSSPPSTIIESASYRIYRVLDAYEAIPYGTGSDLQTLTSYDVSGNYFELDMDLLQPGYEYAIKFSFYDSKMSTWNEQNGTFKFRVEEYEY
jgi:hypothetical protein